MSCRIKHDTQIAGLIVALLMLAAGPGWTAQRTTPVVVPDNAYATGASYGSGWKCNYGFKQAKDACLAVVVPANAYLSERGENWRCERGYRRNNDECQQISVPANGYLDPSAQKGWTCERGYRATRDSCDLVVVPANAYATNNRFGDMWVCERGYLQSGDACEKIEVPDNAFLVDLNYGSGWQCERGYVAVGKDRCDKLNLPPDSHLTWSGNEWKCNTPYRKRGEACLSP